MSHLELNPVIVNEFLTIRQATGNTETTGANQSIDRDISLSHTDSINFFKVQEILQEAGMKTHTLRPSPLPYIETWNINSYTFQPSSSDLLILSS